MIIERHLSEYVVFSEDSIIEALKRISNNRRGIVFSVNGSGILEGILTDGDFRRWLVQQRTIDLNQPVIRVANKNYQYLEFGVDPKRIEGCFSGKIRYVPLLDNLHRLVAIATNQQGDVKIGHRTIDSHSPVFVIAEIGNNHNGSLARAYQLIDKAIEAGADCVKFQMRSLKHLYNNGGDANDLREDIGSQYVLDLLTRFQLSVPDLFSAFDYCRHKGAIPLCTPWDMESLDHLKRYGMDAYKIGSPDLTHSDLLKEVARTGKPAICSTGMATEREIIDSVSLLKEHGASLILLHCNSTYPAPYQDIQLKYLNRLKEIGDCPVGYSGHERGYSVVLAAVAMGAKVIEKHFTLDKFMEGNDHKISLLPDEFHDMIKAIRQVEASMGQEGERNVSQGERLNREVLAKSLSINCSLELGAVITSSMIDVKSPGKGLQPNRKSELIGQRAKRTFTAGDFFYESDLTSDPVLPRNYEFKRPWGIPVRFHDFKILLAKTNPSLLEFHLSYKDLDFPLEEAFEESYDLDLVIHSPEFFAGDHLLDLCSLDEEYRLHSLSELQRVIDMTRRLKPFFSKSKQPLIITNVGGFTMDAPLPVMEQQRLYEQLERSLASLDDEEVEIIVQTMPPFPWHFGGQRFHNLFVTPENTAQFCRDYQRHLCLDLSHSKLATNQLNLSFQEYLEQVAPFALHLHISDARGTDGEGIQINDGEIDFSAVATQLDQLTPQASFIPEVWQAHKNEGEGFWIALDRLEKWF